MPDFPCTVIGFDETEGEMIIEIPATAWTRIADWLNQRGVSPETTVRDYNLQPTGAVRFACGMGYDVVDMDVLGGDGTGRLSKSLLDETGVALTIPAITAPGSPR